MQHRAASVRRCTAAVSISIDDRDLVDDRQEHEEHITDLRVVVLHMIEETARHLGHLDAARELIDGRTGLAQDDM